MKIKFFHAVIFLLFIIVFTGCEQEKGEKWPVNIILFIGDGMGPAQLSAAIFSSDSTLVFESFPYSGFLKTSSSDQFVTDSGAAGTAIATGTKTRNGMIGMGPDSLPVSSIMEIAHLKGLSTGLVSTSAITHATPASFVAHNSGRGNYEDIARDFMKGTIDVFIGGGADHFNKRSDGTDITGDLKEQGYDVVYTLDQLLNSEASKIAGLLAPQHMGRSDSDRMGMLGQMTGKAIGTLSRNKKGFVLMVEGSQIDWAGHANDLSLVVSEVIDMNDAIIKAYKFASETKNTLVVVTSDHETGGLSLVSGNLHDKSIAGNFGTQDHTAVMVPVFSYGPGAERFSGIRENTYIFDEFIKLLRLNE